jgi:hypothetical protein
VLGNPLKYTDPTGHYASICLDGVQCYDGGSTLPILTGGPSPLNNNNEDEDQCPDWNTCVIDVSGEIIEDYWNANNDFLNTMNNTLIWYDLVGVGCAVLAYLSGTSVISAESIALILGISLLDPSPIEEIIIVGGLAVGVTALTANLITADIQNVNNAIVTSGVLQTGGSITANWDGVTITNPEGVTTFVDTLVPFASQISLASWASGSPLLIPGYPTP